MILTTLGMMDEADLHKRTGGHDDPDETVTWVELSTETMTEVVGRFGWMAFGCAIDIPATAFVVESTVIVVPEKFVMLQLKDWSA